MVMAITIDQGLEVFFRRLRANRMFSPNRSNILRYFGRTMAFLECIMLFIFNKSTHFVVNKRHKLDYFRILTYRFIALYGLKAFRFPFKIVIFIKERKRVYLSLWKRSYSTNSTQSPQKLGNRKFNTG